MKIITINGSPRKDENEMIFVEATGHVYTKREQMLAEIILRLAKKWICRRTEISVYERANLCGLELQPEIISYGMMIVNPNDTEHNAEVLRQAKEHGKKLADAVKAL